MPKTKEKYFAHSREGCPVKDWQPLEEHLENTAVRCRHFAEQFKAGALGELAGRFHDLGKGSLEFQAYLRHANDIEDEFSAYFESRWKRDHATFGARYLHSLSKQTGKLLEYCIAGHHSGLQNWADGSQNSGLRYRLEDKTLRKVLFPFEEKTEIPPLPPLHIDRNLSGFQLQFLIRMLFSCLIDADRLDTEGFTDPEKAIVRENDTPLQELHSINVLE